MFTPMYAVMSFRPKCRSTFGPIFVTVTSWPMAYRDLVCLVFGLSAEQGSVHCLLL